MNLQKNLFIQIIRVSFLLFCYWCHKNAAEEILNIVNPQNVQFVPQPFYVAYNTVPLMPQRNVLQKIGSGFLNAMKRLRTRTRVVYGSDPSEQNSLSTNFKGPFQRRPLIQRFRERIKDRRIISTTTSEPQLQYYGALSQKYQILMPTNNETLGSSVESS